MGRKETPLYNSKSKKQLSKLDKEFGENTLALLEKILERPLISIDELKALLTPVGPSSPKSLSGDASPCYDPLLVAQDLFVFIPFSWIICLLPWPAGAQKLVWSLSISSCVCLRAPGLQLVCVLVLVCHCLFDF
ncbi:hypothetical protein Hanom_Chr06g00569701 [Helianthus anomalus]